MSYEIYKYIFIGAAIICGILLVVAIALFFALKIPKVIGDLTGSTAKKAIKDIREQNEKSGDKGHQISGFNKERGRLTDKISPSGNIIQQPSSNFAGIQTTKISTQQLAEDPNTTVFSAETTMLSSETTVLGNPINMPVNETTVLSQTTVETIALNNDLNATVILDQAGSNETTILSAVLLDPYFAIEYDITFIHTNEIIG